MISEGKTRTLTRTRRFQLRTYTLRTDDAHRHYAEIVYPRHLRSMLQFGVELHGFWTKMDDTAPRLVALVSYADGDDPDKVERRYLHSPELAEDIEGFDRADITDVETAILIPSAQSPLR